MKEVNIPADDAIRLLNIHGPTLPDTPLRITCTDTTKKSARTKFLSDAEFNDLVADGAFDHWDILELKLRMSMMVHCFNALHVLIVRTNGDRMATFKVPVNASKEQIKAYGRAQRRFPDVYNMYLDKINSAYSKEKEQ